MAPRSPKPDPPADTDTAEEAGAEPVERTGPEVFDTGERIPKPDKEADGRTGPDVFDADAAT